MVTIPEEISLFDAQKDYMSAVFDGILVVYSTRDGELERYLRNCGTRPQAQLRLISKQAVSCRLSVKFIMETDLLNQVPKFLSSMVTADRAEFLSDASKKQHMRYAVQPNLDLRQVSTIEDTLRHEDPTKVYNDSTYLQRIRNAADSYDAFSKSIRRVSRAMTVISYHVTSLTILCPPIFGHSQTRNGQHFGIGTLRRTSGHPTISIT